MTVTTIKIHFLVVNGDNEYSSYFCKEDNYKSVGCSYNHSSTLVMAYQEHDYRQDNCL